LLEHGDRQGDVVLLEVLEGGEVVEDDGGVEDEDLALRIRHERGDVLPWGRPKASARAPLLSSPGRISPSAILGTEQGDQPWPSRISNRGRSPKRRRPRRSTARTPSRRWPRRGCAGRRPGPSPKRRCRPGSGTSPPSPAWR